DLAGACRFGRLLHRALLHLGDAERNADDDARPHQCLAVVNLLDEVAQHRLGDVEVGDHAVFERSNGDDRARRAAEHLLGLRADRDHAASAACTLRHREAGRLVPADAFAFAVYQGVGRPQVDRQIVGEHAEKEVQHHPPPASCLERETPSRVPEFIVRGKFASVLAGMQVAFSTGVLYRFSLPKESPTVLNAMRKSADSPVLKILFVAIVLVFMFWGVGSMRASRMEVAAHVNDEVVTRRQFDDAYKRLSAMYQNAGQQAPPADYLRSQTIDQLIDAELLVQEANRLGLTVDEDELREAIAAAPDFQNSGRFDKELYLRVLQSNGFKPSDFEELQRRRLMASKVQELVRSGVQVTDQELKDRFRYDNERLNLRFVRVPAAPLQSSVTITDEDVQKYFAENQEQYREPERVRIKLVEFRPDDIAKQITPTDAEVQAYYDAHIEEYRRGDEVHARHILFTVAPDAPPADKAAARKKAEEVLAKAKAGEDFIELAKTYSQDTTSVSGGDLGRVGRGVMTPA